MEVVKPKVATPKMEAKKAATPKVQPKAAAADEDDDQEEEEEEEDEEEAIFVFVGVFFRISFAEKQKTIYTVIYTTFFDGKKMIFETSNFSSEINIT